MVSILQGGCENKIKSLMERNQPGAWHKMEACVLAGPAMLPDTLGGRVTKQQSTQKCLLLLVPEHAKCSHPHEKQQDWI